MRIPSGWHISLNCFFEVDPTPDTMEWFYGSVLIGGTNLGTGYCFDARFEPEGDPNGSYVVDFIRVKFDKTGEVIPESEKVIGSATSKTRHEFSSILENYMESPQTYD